MHLLSHLTLNFSTREGTKVDRTAGRVTSLERQLVNSRAPEIAIYLRASFHRQAAGKQLMCARYALILREQTARIAATRLVLTAVIQAARLVDHFQTVGHLVKWKLTVK